MPEHEQKSLGEVVKELAESSSMHGIPKIVSSPQRYVKVLWCILVIGTFTLMSYQLYSLFGNFNSNPVITKVNLEFSSLRFPAITFCNMNPVRKSKLDLVPALKDIIYKKKTVKKEVNRPRYDEYGYPIPQGPPANLLLNESTILNNGTYSNETDSLRNSSVLDADYGQDANETDSPSGTYYYSLAEDYNDSDTRYSGGYGYNDTQYPYLDTSYYHDPWDYDRYGMYESYYNYSRYSDYFDESAFDTDTIDLITSPRDVWKKQRDEIKTAMKNTSIWTVIDAGHQIEDMVYSFSFAGRRQNMSDIRRFFSTHYGNCYVIASHHTRKLKAWRSGPEHGIKLTLNLESSEYIENFASGFGMKFVFNQPGVYPMPSEEGLMISSGFDTSIGLRAVHVSRLGHPYGVCSDGKQYKKKYGYAYSVASCMEMCRIERVMSKCRCLPYDSPQSFSTHSTGLGVCQLPPSSDSMCALEVEYNMEKNRSACDCPSACNEIVYEKTLSGRAWPSEEYLSRVLIRDICKRNISSTRKACAERESGTLKPEKYINNFLTVRIYFEDLNYESIVQEPMYEPVRFVSDIGGALGLFLGISVLTVVEVFQLMLEVCLHVFRRLNPYKTTLKDQKQKLDGGGGIRMI